MWVDEKLSSLVWNRVMGKICEEWQGFTLFVSIHSLTFSEVVHNEIVPFQGTVLLNANVAFLAIPSVDNGLPSKGHGRSVAEIASYASVLTSIGSIILGLLLERQNRTKERETAHEAVRSIS